MNNVQTVKTGNKKEAGKTVYRASVMLLPDKMHFIIAHDIAGVLSFKSARTAVLPANLYAEPTNAAVIDAVKNEIHTFAAEILPSYAVINIVIPDPVSELVYFSTADTSGKADSREFLRLKSAEKLKVQPSGMSFWTVENRDKTNGINASAFSALSSFTDVITSALFDSGLAASGSAPGFCYINDLHNDLISGKECGIFVLELDYWSFVLCRKNGMPVLMISGFFEAGLKPDKISSTALAEIERRLRAYAVSNKEFNMEHMFISAPEDVCESAYTQAQSRFNCEFTQLTTTLTGENGLKDFPVSLIAAAGLK